MTLKLTPDILRAAYEFLNSCEPFKFWNLPDGEDIEFHVSDDRVNHAWVNTGRRRKQPRIVVSRALVGHTLSLLQAIAHEMVHLIEVRAGLTPHNVQHGAAFKKLAARVCKIHGFDPKTF
jgi:hypothetical protein